MALTLAAFAALGSAHAYNAKQVRRAETDANECRQSHAHYRTKYADNLRLAELLTQRDCALFDEVAKEKRKACEVRKQEESRRIAEDAPGEMRAETTGAHR